MHEIREIETALEEFNAGAINIFQFTDRVRCALEAIEHAASGYVQDYLTQEQILRVQENVLKALI